ncbi:MAG TPA: hypothetical protein VF765_03445 [Polyangiaceae bacterium]
MRRVLTRAAAIAAVLLPMLDGCTVVAGLGDSKEPPDGGTTSSGSSSGSTIGDADIPEDASGPPLQPFAIAVGGTHACALLNGPSGQPSGVVRCWGSNQQGELGADPTSAPESPLPLAVPSVTDARTLALSTGYSCATTSSGNMLCWGAVAAELPTGMHRTQETPAFEPSYMEVDTGLLDMVQAASVGPAGGAVLTSSALVSWGSAMYEQRDSGSGAGSDAGVTLGALGRGAVGRAHACAITQDMSDVQCWGDNSHGQCGVSPQGSSFLTYPTWVGLSAMNVGTISDIAAGADFTCAVTSMGAVYCWGANDAGQLGNPSASGDQSTPTQVELTGFTAQELALGDKHACVQTAGFSVHCWGDNSVGQLGLGGISSYVAKPGNVYVDASTKLESVVHIAAGGNTTCATRVTDSSVWCWGANDSGQSGQPSSSMSVVRYATAISP